MRGRLGGEGFPEGAAVIQFRHDVPPDGSPKPQKALHQLVSDPAGKIERLEQEVERLRLDDGNLHASNQALKDGIARLKNLPLHPPSKPSGMENATQPQACPPVWAGTPGCHQHCAPGCRQCQAGQAGAP